MAQISRGHGHDDLAPHFGGSDTQVTMLGGSNVVALLTGSMEW
jgi:hypothetical protein